jgi:hypothetical protein
MHCRWGRWWRSVRLLSNVSRLILKCSVRSVYTCVHADSLPPITGTVRPLPHFFINLSKATKLEDVAFTCPQSPQWVASTLRTITSDHRNFRQISLSYGNRHLNTYHITPHGFQTLMGDADYQGWLKLDRLVVELWESHSVRLRVLYGGPASSASMPGTKFCMESLFPETTVKGVVDPINYDDAERLLSPSDLVDFDLDELM